MTDANTYITEIFLSSAAAEKAYMYAIQCGYSEKDINIIMSEDSKHRYYDSILTDSNNTLEDVAKGGTVGGTVGGTIGALIALGTSVLIPGLGFIIAGPLAGAVAGTLMGTVLALGVSEKNAQEYEEEIKAGAIILSVPEKNACDIKERWRLIKEHDKKANETSANN